MREKKNPNDQTQHFIFDEKPICPNLFTRKLQMYATEIVEENSTLPASCDVFGIERLNFKQPYSLFEH